MSPNSSRCYDPKIIDTRRILRQDSRIQVTNKTKNETYQTQHTLSKRQVEIIVEGSLINVVRKRHIHT